MSQFRNPPEIEELSELGWKRIEHRLFQDDLVLDVTSRQRNRVSSSGSGRRGRLWLVGGLTLAAAAAIFLFVLPAAQGPEEQAVASSQRSRIETQSSASEVYIGDAAIEVSPRSAIWIDRLADDIAISLDDGGVRLRVESATEASPLRVHASDLRIEVWSADFSVYRQASRVEVEVFGGTVTLLARGKRSTLRAGDVWPVTQAPPATPESGPKVPAQIESAPTPRKKTPAPSPRSLFEQATELEASAPEAAVALYKQVARGSGPWAANALFAQGRLQHARGELVAAQRILTRYLERFPVGPNAGDARALLAR